MTVNFLHELLSFDFPRDQFALFGSAPLVVRGIKDGNSDLDILVTDHQWDQIVSIYNPPVKKALSGDEALILTPNIEIFKTWPPFENPGDLILNADIIEGVRFVKLEDVLAWKSSLGREKDMEDIKKIKSYFSETSMAKDKE